jgi:integrase
MTDDTPKRPRTRGAGSIFQNGSAKWWIKYYRDNKPIRENSGSTEYRKAENVLKQRIAEVEAERRGLLTFTTPADRRVTVDSLYSALLTNYENNGLASLEGARQRWQRNAKENEKPEPGRLQQFFGGVRAVTVNGDKFEQYIKQCREDGLSNSTINRDLAALRRAFSLAYRAGKIQRIPIFPERLKEPPARKGFLEQPEFDKLTTHSPELWLRSLLECLYTWGNRKSELLKLRVGQIDLVHGVVRLNQGETKSGDGRVLPMSPAIRTLLTACVSGKDGKDHVFTDGTGNRRRKRGAPILDFRGRWERLLSDAGVSEKIVHDFRRTAIRNMERAGIPRSVAMKISGHKTEAVYRRYAIVCESDLMEAATKLAAARTVWAENGQNLGQNGNTGEHTQVLSRYN